MDFTRQGHKIKQADENSTGLPLYTRGSILNVGSLCSHVAIPGLNPYIMAKHGVLGLTKADALDYAQHGIRVNCLCPGWTQTGMTKSISENDESVSQSFNFIFFEHSTSREEPPSCLLEGIWVL
jgi:NAD(P)-dependent dehydrogenase (short-subunit alcohol dehydrogenase family)